MNVISLAVWTLENNCLIVYTTLIVSFTLFTIFHKRRLEESYRRTSTDKKEKLTRNFSGGRGDSFFFTLRVVRLISTLDKRA